jgi:hypothetical protein
MTAAYLNLGDALQKLGDRKGAIVVYEKVVELDAKGTDGTLARTELSALRAQK